MMAFGVVFLLVCANGLTGWLFLRRWARTFDTLEMIFASITFGVCVNGWQAFVLAEMGWFSITALAILWLIEGVLFLFLPIYPSESPLPAKSRSFLLPNWLEFPILFIWLCASLWLYFRPHEFIMGGADAGVYVNLGAEIAQHGSIVLHDTSLAELDPTLYSAFLEPVASSVVQYTMFPAFYVMDASKGEIQPQFYPLHPVWFAVAFGLVRQMGGATAVALEAVLLMTGLWALLGAFAVYLVVKQMAGWETAVLALAGLSLNALQIWFARYPVTESLTLYLLWVGLWGLGAWLSQRNSRPIWGLLAGLALGQTFLVRIDMLFILPIFILLGLWQWLSEVDRRALLWFWVPFGLMVAHSLIHALWQSQPYFYDLFGFAVTLFTVYWEIPMVLGLFGLLALGFLGRFRGRLDVLGLYQRPLAVFVISLILLFAVYAWFIRPYTVTGYVWDDPYSRTQIIFTDHENLLRLGWYLSPIGVWLGIAGVCWLVWQMNRQTAVLLAVSLFFSFFYLWAIRANPHQIYAMRRYVPATMPLFVIGAAVLLGQLAWKSNKPSSVVGYLLIICWLGGFAWSARGFISHVDYLGVTDQLSQLNAQLEPKSILIFDDQNAIGLGYFFGTTLKYTFGHDVLVLRHPENFNESLMVEMIHAWQNNGRVVYWFGTSTWLEAHQFAYVEQSHTLSSSYLENSYEHKPTAVIPVQWPMTIYQIK